MKLLLSAAVAVVALNMAMPAKSAVTILGQSDARTCYERARDRNTSQDAIMVCNRAFEGAMGRYEEVATYVNRGIVHMIRGSYSLASADFDAAIARNPEEPEAWLNKGLLLLKMNGREAEAVDIISTAIGKRTRKEALAYYARGVAHEGSGNLAAAYADYRRANQLAPDWELPAQDLKRFRVVGRSGGGSA